MRDDTVQILGTRDDLARTAEMLGAKLLREGVASRVRRLRDLVDRIERDAERAIQQAEQGRGTYGRVVGEIDHEITWGIANLQMSTLASTATDADIAHAEANGRGAADNSPDESLNAVLAVLAKCEQMRQETADVPGGVGWIFADEFEAVIRAAMPGADANIAHAKGNGATRAAAIVKADDTSAAGRILSLAAMERAAKGWAESAAQNDVDLDRRDRKPSDEQTFVLADILRMIDDAAREVGVSPVYSKEGKA